MVILATMSEFYTQLLQEAEETYQKLVQEAKDGQDSLKKLLELSSLQECMCCSPRTLERTPPSVNVTPSPSVQYANMTYVICESCERSICFICAAGFLKFILNCKYISSSVKDRDLSIQVLRDTVSAHISGHLRISRGICCSFSGSASLKCLSCQPTPRFEVNHNATTYSSQSKRQTLTSVRRKIGDIPSDDSNSDFLFDYFKNTTEYLYERYPHKTSTTTLHKINHNRKSKPPYHHNIFQGALHLPSFGLCIQSDASNNMLYCDHHALAPSRADGTPGILHGVLSLQSASSAHLYSQTIGKSPSRIRGNSKRIVVENVSSPHDAETTRNIVVEIITVHQVLPCDDVMKLKGLNDFSPEYLMKQSYFGNNDVRKDVDATMILGSFDLENKSLPPKLLLFRFHGMIINHMKSLADRNVMVDEIYSSLRPICGKRGFEIRRFCGSSGLTTPDSDRNLLTVLLSHEGTLPRKIFSTIIIRDTSCYHIIYRKGNIKSDKSPYAHVCYSPPQEGGPFSMPDNCISLHPILSELTYVKMFSVSILTEYNFQRVIRGELPVAIGPLTREKKNMDMARLQYSTAKANPMFSLIRYYNSCNKFSMVAYPVGMHNDHFRLSRESLENRILLCLSEHGQRGKKEQVRNLIGEFSRNKIGRGGSLVGIRYVYALLDW